VQRLKTRPQFEAALAQRPLARTAHFSLHCCAVEALPTGSNESREPNQPVQPAVWLGALIPKRWAKRAVTRNAIRRQIYAVAADSESRLLKRVHVVRLRASFDKAQFVSASSDSLKAAIRAELQQLLS
jgi:ribonuclease P protein component